MDYEDVALFSDEKKYVALIKNATPTVNAITGAARRSGFIRGPRVFTEQPVFRLFLFRFPPFPSPHHRAAFLSLSLSVSVHPTLPIPRSPLPFLGWHAATSEKS